MKRPASREKEFPRAPEDPHRGWPDRDHRAVAAGRRRGGQEEEAAEGDGDDPQHLPRVGAHAGVQPPAGEPIEFAEEAGKIYRNVQETNFVARAKPLAKEIDEANVDLVGLQEVALWRRDTLGAPDGDATPANEVVYDFLHQLRSELRERGLEYRVASVQQEADLEFPLDFEDDGAPDFAYDGRLTMRDVILAKDSRKLKTRDEQSENYGFNASITIDLAPPGAGPEDQELEFTRGYNAVEVVKKAKGKKKGKGASAAGKKKRGKTKFRFVNTHLEAFSAFPATHRRRSWLPTPPTRSTGKGDRRRRPQLRPRRPDLDPGAAVLAPARDGERGARTSGSPTPASSTLGASENTCCHANNLLNPPPAAFTSRIDHILQRARGGDGVAGALVGDDASERTPTGLWPSDHGGQWAKLKVK